MGSCCSTKRDETLDPWWDHGGKVRTIQKDSRVKRESVQNVQDLGPVSSVSSQLVSNKSCSVKHRPSCVSVSSAALAAACSRLFFSLLAADIFSVFPGNYLTPCTCFMNQPVLVSFKQNEE